MQVSCMQCMWVLTDSEKLLAVALHERQYENEQEAKGELSN